MTGPARATREPAVAVGLCLAGAALLLASAGRAWAYADQPLLDGATTARTVATGSSLTGVPVAVGLVGLAGVAALAATRGRGRVVLGALLAAVGALAVLALLHTDPAVPGARAEATTGTTAWPLVASAGAALLAVAGLLTLVRGARWAALSRRYDAPAARRAVDPSSAAWDRLDRGEDPTAPPS